MEQVIRATFSGEPCMVEFNSTLGITPGTGTITFPFANYTIPKKGELIISDGSKSVRLSSIYTDNSRLEQSATEGLNLVATIYDRRCTWKWGYIVGSYNKKISDGTNKKDVMLKDLLLKCLVALYESDAVLQGIPEDEYPEVNWEYANPANELNDLCEKYSLAIGISANDNRVIILPYNTNINIATNYVSETMVGSENTVLPKRMYLIGGRRVLQREFTNLVPVGEDIDGSIKKINDLSYAPAGVSEEAYSDEIWGQEYMRMFSNLSTDVAKKLAEECLFKWYAINWDSEPSGEIDRVLPLLNKISTIVSIDGVEEHDKPYVKGKRQSWDGITHEIITSIGVITKGYTIDEKLGIVKFTKPQYIAHAEGSDPESFVRPELTLVAAYDSKYNDTSDFVGWYRDINYGTEIPAVYIDKNIIEYFIRNEDSKIFESQNGIALDKFALSVVDKLEEKHMPTHPKIYTYAGIQNISAIGNICSVTWRADLNGAETIVQIGIELPTRQLPTYEERLNKRKLSFLLSAIK